MTGGERGEKGGEWVGGEALHSITVQLPPHTTALTKLGQNQSQTTSGQRPTQIYADIQKLELYSTRSEHVLLMYVDECRRKRVEMEK